MSSKSNVKLLTLLVLILIPTIFYFRFRNPKIIQVDASNAELARCKGEAAAREEAISLFCTLIQQQLSPQECVKTDYVMTLAKKTGNSWIGQCAGLQQEHVYNATSSVDFEPFLNVDPLSHR